MQGTDLRDWLIYLIVIATFYLIPLIFSRRAKKDTAFAAQVWVGTTLVALVLVTFLYVVGAGVVGEWSLGDYVKTIAAYTLPGVFVLCAWVAVLRLSSRTP